MRESSYRVVYLAAEQVLRSLDACLKADNAQLCPYMLVRLDTSMRKSEALFICKDNSTQTGA